MKRALKIVLIVAAVLLLVAVAALFWIDSIARVAVEKGASYALGVETKLDSMRIGLFSGEAGMRGLLVRNPQGFSGDHFLKMEDADLALSLSSVMSDRIVIPRIRLKGMDLFIEQNSSGTNLGKILANLQGEPPTSSPAPATPAPGAVPEASNKGKSFVIEEILIEQTRVGGTLSILGGAPKAISYTIPEIRLQHVGSDSTDGASLAKVVKEIVQAILKGAIEQGKDLPKELVQEWRSKAQNLREELKSKAGELREKADGLKELLRKKKN